MPKYVEERELHPVPGAFGVTMALAQWIRFHRADADFYEGVGRYAPGKCLRIYIEEEYGYREWLWTYFGTVEEFVRDWKEGNRPIAPRCNGRGWPTPYGHPQLYGEFDEITWRPKYCAKRPRQWMQEYDPAWTTGISEHPYIVETGYPVFCINGRYGFDGTAHVHEEEDSVLNISFYRLRGLNDPQVEIVSERVLDEMAKIA